VSSEELLGSCESVPDYKRGAQRKDDMLVVWMKNQSFVDLALKANHRREIKFLF